MSVPAEILATLLLEPVLPAFSTSIGGPVIEVTGQALVPSGRGFRAIVIVRDRDISFGDPWLVEMDSSGTLTSAEKLGAELGLSREPETAGPILELPDGSLLVSAFGEPRATGMDADACVMWIEPDGSMDRAFVLGEDDEEVYRINGLGLFDDGAVLVAGTTGCGGAAPFCWICSESGTHCLEVSFPDTLAPAAAAGTREGSVVVAAEGGPGGLVLVWIDRQGRTIRAVDLGRIPAVSPDAAVEALSIGATGRIYLSGSSYPNPWICCLEPDGGFRWSATWGGEGRITDVEETGTGSIACCGCTSLGNSRISACLTMYSREGDLLWRRLFENGEYTSFEGMTMLDDGGFLLAGSSDLSGTDDVWSEAFLVSTGPDGLPDLEQSGGAPAGRRATRFQSFTRPPEGSVVACGVYDTPEDACESAAHASDASFLTPGVLWIPDCPSLSGHEGWLAYLVPEHADGPLCDTLFSQLGTGWPDAYLLPIGPVVENRRRLPVTGE